MPASRDCISSSCVTGFWSPTGAITSDGAEATGPMVGCYDSTGVYVMKAAGFCCDDCVYYVNGCWCSDATVYIECNLKGRVSSRIVGETRPSYCDRGQWAGLPANYKYSSSQSKNYISQVIWKLDGGDSQLHDKKTSSEMSESQYSFLRGSVSCGRGCRRRVEIN